MLESCFKFSQGFASGILKMRVVGETCETPAPDQAEAFAQDTAFLEGGPVVEVGLAVDDGHDVKGHVVVMETVAALAARYYSTRRGAALRVQRVLADRVAVSAGHDNFHAVKLAQRDKLPAQVGGFGRELVDRAGVNHCYSLY